MKKLLLLSAILIVCISNSYGQYNFSVRGGSLVWNYRLNLQFSNVYSSLLMQPTVKIIDKSDSYVVFETTRRKRFIQKESLDDLTAVVSNKTYFCRVRVEKDSLSVNAHAVSFCFLNSSYGNTPIEKSILKKNAIRKNKVFYLETIHNDLISLMTYR